MLYNYQFCCLHIISTIKMNYRAPIEIIFRWLAKKLNCNCRVHMFPCMGIGTCTCNSWIYLTTVLVLRSIGKIWKRYSPINLSHFTQIQPTQVLVSPTNPPYEINSEICLHVCLYVCMYAWHTLIHYVAGCKPNYIKHVPVYTKHM